MNRKVTFWTCNGACGDHTTRAEARACDIENTEKLLAEERRREGEQATRDAYEREMDVYRRLNGGKDGQYRLMGFIRERGQL